MIAIVNYGLGNVQAIADIYRRLGIAARMATTPADLSGAQKIILPGVGAFDWAMKRLDESGMRAALDHAAIDERKPVLGICVGMQMMAGSSEEGQLSGLGWIEGRVRRFDAETFSSEIHLPHMGWNDVHARPGERLFDGLDGTSRFYFLHSFHFLATHERNVMALTDYHGSFASAVVADNLYGVQFHPEKSHQWGVRLLKNFAEL